MNRQLLPLALLLLLAGCAVPQPDPAAAPVAPLPTPSVLPPPGFGTLRQDQFSIELRAGAVQLRVTPLDESVLRLAAPDTYRRLSGLAVQQQAALREQLASPETPMLFLVSFFSREPGASFQPTDVVIESGGRRFRPVQVVGLTPAWGEQRLRAQEAESAIYAFEPRLDLGQPMTLHYAGQTSEQWREIIPLLQEERARVLARAGGQD